MAKHSLYDDSPHIEHNDKGGTSVSKAKPSEKHAEHESDGQNEKGVKGEGFSVDEHHAMQRLDMHHRHVKERLDLHTRHAMEHRLHKGPKHELHKRHENDLKALHGRHEQELKALHASHDKEPGAMGGKTTDEPIEKVEKGAK